MSSATIFRASAVYAAAAASTHGCRNPHRNFSVSLSMKDASSVCFQQCKMEDASQGPQIPDVPELSGLRFNRILPPHEEIDCEHKREFGNYIARAAIWGEEYWAAAWLRAEAKWEDQSDGRIPVAKPLILGLVFLFLAFDRYVDSLKKQFADQEFHALKQRCTVRFGEKCTCIIAVKKDQIKRKNTALNCVVGTLDLNFRYLSSDETFPTVRDRAAGSSRTYKTAANRYGYVSNLCVRKSARRQGIASNMLLLAVQVAESQGVKDVFVHVHKDNIAAQRLYEKIGFQMVEMDVAHSSAAQNYLMSFKA
ncbi:hypothetical protein ACLOJK_034703 [Asimina triloba]